jgi:hypothetical protein
MRDFVEVVVLESAEVQEMRGELVLLRNTGAPID